MIRVDLSRCTGCRRCEVECAFYHTGRVNRRLARIKVLNLYEIGIDGPVLCIQCKERYCMHCPEKALTLGAMGQVIVSPTLCTRCGTCEKACPIGAVELFEEIPYLCDLCGGRPRCVDACTEGALTLETGEHTSLATLKKQTRKLGPGLKRHFYLKGQSRSLRKQWREAHA